MRISTQMTIGGRGRTRIRIESTPIHETHNCSYRVNGGHLHCTRRAQRRLTVTIGSRRQRTMVFDFCHDHIDLLAKYEAESEGTLRRWFASKTARSSQESGPCEWSSCWWRRI